MALSPNQLQNISNELEDLWGDFETEVLSQLAQRIKANDYTVSSTTRWQRAKMKELGYTNDYINQRLSVYLKKTEVEVKAIFDKAIEGALKSNDEIISEAHELGLLQSSGYDIEKYAPLITTGARQTFNEIKNWTKSYHAEVNKNFQVALDRAYLNVTSGLLSSSEATKQAIEELAKKGILTSSTSKNRVERAEAIVKRAIRSGVNQTTSKVMEGVLDDLDCDLIEVSSHLGARPSHAEWQGKVYSRSGKDKKYPDFVEATGYGSGDGSSGWNCRHSFYPFFEGLSSVSAKRISMEENERVYQLQQQQRYNERVIRKYRREETVLKSGELDHSVPKRKAIEWTKKNDELIKANSDVFKKGSAKKATCEKSLSIIEKETIKEYVGSYSYKINEKLRNNTVLNETEKVFVDTLNSALSKMPVHKGKVIRELTLMSAEDFMLFNKEHNINGMVKYPQFISTSLKDGYHEKPNARILINSVAGRDITEYNNREMEILFRTNSLFKVVNKEIKNDIIYLYMEEVYEK